MSLDIADRMVVTGMRANSMTARAGKKSHETTPHCAQSWPRSQLEKAKASPGTPHSPHNPHGLALERVVSLPAG